MLEKSLTFLLCYRNPCCVREISSRSLWLGLLGTCQIFIIPTVFPGSSDGRVCLQCRRPGFDPWVRKIPWKRKWQSTRVLAWKIPWTEEPGGLRSGGSQRVRHDLATNTFTAGLLSESWFSSGQQCIQVKTAYFTPLFVTGNDQFDVSRNRRIRDAGNGFKKLT